MNDCLVCMTELADHYDSPFGHERACGVGDLHDPASAVERLYHRAVRVEHHGGSWSLNVYAAACGATGLTHTARGIKPCLTCFPNHPELLENWKRWHKIP